jgi:hypothetical protein
MSTPILMSESWAVAEVVPAAIGAMGAPLCAAFGVPSSHFGAKGNNVHDYGPHRSYNWIINSPYSRFRFDDRSVLGALNSVGIDRNAISAFDITPGSRAKMRQMTERVYQASLARDPRLRTMREFAGTRDGVHVVRFVCDGGGFLSPYDSSHLDHGHGTFWRRYAHDDHSGVVQILIGDDVLTPTQEQQLANIHDWIFDTARGLIAADAGTPHVTTYVPNQWLKALFDRPPVVPAPVDAAALAAELAGNAAFVNAIAGAVAAQVNAALPTEAQREQDAFEGAQRAEDE